MIASIDVYRESEFFDIVYDEIGAAFSDDQWATVADYINQMQYLIHEYIEPLIPEGHKQDEYEFHQWIDEDNGVAIIRQSKVPRSFHEDSEGDCLESAIW